MSEREDEATNQEITEDVFNEHHESILETNYATSEVHYESGTQTEEASNDYAADGAEVMSTNIGPTFLTSGETGHDVMAAQSSAKVKEVASHVSVTSDVGNSTASGEIDSSCLVTLSNSNTIGPCQGHAHSHCSCGLLMWFCLLIVSRLKLSFVHYNDHQRFLAVKIMLMPDGHMMTIAFAIGVTTRELKEHFANELKVPSGVIQLSLDGKC